MTSPHQDAADLVAELRSPTTYACVQLTHRHRLDYDKGHQLLNRAANLIEQQAKALGEAEAHIKRLADAVNQMRASGCELKGRLAEAMKHLTILSDDMSDVVEAQYVDRKDYPSEARRYERDMAPVRAARSFLNSASNKEPR